MEIKDNYEDWEVMELIERIIECLQDLKEVKVYEVEGEINSYLSEFQDVLDEYNKIQSARDE